MKSDILPPWQSKAKNQKKPKQKVAVSEKIAPSKPKPVIKSYSTPIEVVAPVQPARKLSIRHLRPHHWYSLNKRDKLMVLCGLMLIAVGLTMSIYYLMLRKSPVPLTSAPAIVKAAPKPITAAAPLTGLQVDPALTKRPVTGIMIENSIDARPQSGLQDAGVVFEAIAEGGITRFIALFQDTRPTYIGPVRSLRPYYIDFATPFDASIAHVGGSPEALDQIRSGGKDLDQFFNSGSYWRQPTRDAPHNVYTSFDKLDGLNTAKGYTTSTVQSWLRKKEKPLKVPTTKAIDVNISSALFNSHYDYDAATNSYNRSEGGKPHLVTSTPDDKTAQQLHPKVVIVMAMSYGLAADLHHSEYGVNGSGSLSVFQDGGVVQGTWEKTDRNHQFVLKDAAGAEIQLTAGQTWVAIVGSPAMVNYKP